MELHCQWGLSKLNLSQSSKFLGEKCVYSSVKFLSVYPTDLYSIYYVERWLKCISYQKLLSLEMTLILKSFQSPSEKSHMRTEGRGIIACVIFVTAEVLQSFQWKFLFNPCGCRSFSRGFVSLTGCQRRLK